MRVPLALYPMAEATAPQGAHRVTSSVPKGFYEELGFMKEEKKVPHPCQPCQHVSLSFSVSLPTSSCHPSEASATRSHTTDSFPSSCQYQSFRRISVTAFVATSLSPSLLHLLTCALISRRSNNTAALFKLCCTQLSHLRAFRWEVYQLSIVSSYTITHNVTCLELRKE